MELFALKDVKAGTFGNPLSFVNRGVALRSLGEAASSPESALNKFPHDFQLFALGEFDQFSGKLTLLDTPDFVITVGDLLTNGADPTRQQRAA